MEQRSVLYVSNIEASFRRQAHITRLKNDELQRARSGDEGEASNIEGDVDSESSANDASSSEYAGSNAVRLLDSGSDVWTLMMVTFCFRTDQRVQGKRVRPVLQRWH